MWTKNNMKRRNKNDEGTKTKNNLQRKRKGDQCTQEKIRIK